MCEKGKSFDEKCCRKSVEREESEAWKRNGVLHEGPVLRSKVNVVFSSLNQAKQCWLQIYDLHYQFLTSLFCAYIFQVPDNLLWS